VPYATRRFRIEKIALTCLFITGITQTLISFTQSQVLLWALGIPLAVAVQVGFTSMLTSFSNGATKNEQGWAMGITGAVIALSFTITGLSPNLVPKLGVMPIIFIGAILMFLGALTMLFYCRRFLKKER
jgi:DHA1 family tetracycline resistance protein-like MFS transporter